MLDDNLAPEFDDDVSEDGVSSESLEKLGELLEGLSVSTLAATVERHPAPCLTFVLARTTYETQQLAATMHLSGIFGVTEDIVRAVIVKTRRSAIEQLLEAAGMRLACGPKLRENLLSVCRYERLLRAIGRRGRIMEVAAMFESRDVGAVLRRLVLWIGEVAEQIAGLTRDVRAIAGVSELEAGRMVGRIGKEFRDASP